MVDIAGFIEQSGSLVATWELHRVGIKRDDIARAVIGGSLVRVRQGWYCNPFLDIESQRAARVGGQLACLSAARALGLWVPEGDRSLHVAVDRNACRLREPSSYRKRLEDPSAVVHWSGRDDSFSRVVVPARLAVEQIIRCCPPETAFVVAESALHTGVVSRSEWHGIVDRLPREHVRSLPAVGDQSGSGIESIFVNRIRRLGHPVRQQVLIPGVGYVDVVLGERLIIELDGERFHQDLARDRHRDAVASIQGYRTLRFMANHVTRDWQLVEQAVIAAIIRGDHRPA